MGIFRNTSGLITRGLGEAQKLITRGLGPAKKVIKGLPPKVDVLKEYVIEICGPVKKENKTTMNVYNPVRRITNKIVSLNCSVSKKVIKAFNILTNVTSKKLFKILDAI